MAHARKLKYDNDKNHFFVIIFVAISFGQYRSNSLPFLLIDYPTYEINGKPQLDSSSESIVLNRVDFETLYLEYPSFFQLCRVNGDHRSFGEVSSLNWTAPEYEM